MATRNRVIYQSEALYVGQPEATGNHITATVIGGQDDGGLDVSGKVFGLVKEPSDISKKCILDNTDYWTLITKPVDVTINEWDNATDFSVDDIVKVTEDGEERYFEALQESGPTSAAGAAKDPFVKLADFTDNGAYVFANTGDTLPESSRC